MREKACWESWGIFQREYCFFSHLSVSSSTPGQCWPPALLLIIEDNAGVTRRLPALPLLSFELGCECGFLVCVLRLTFEIWKYYLRASFGTNLISDIFKLHTQNPGFFFFLNRLKFKVIFLRIYLNVLQYVKWHFYFSFTVLQFSIQLFRYKCFVLLNALAFTNFVKVKFINV